MIHRLALLLVSIVFPLATWAGSVVLETHDGSITLEGELVSFNGELFRVKTAYGTLTMDGGNVTCSGPGCPKAEALIAQARIAGPSDIVHRLITPLLQAYAEKQGYGFRRIYKSDTATTWELSLKSGQLVAVIDGQVTDDSEALRLLAAGDADIAVGRTESGEDAVREDVFALDALVPAVAPDNPRAMVTFDQLQGLLGAGIDNWSRLAGPDLPVALHLPDGKADLLQRLQPSRRFASAIRHVDPDVLSDAVAEDPAALGVASFSSIGNAVPLVVSGACGLAIPATPDTIRAEDYPLTEPLFLHRIGVQQPKLIREFITFTRSYEAQPVIRTTGFVDQAIGRIRFERQGDRLANAVLGAGDAPAAMKTVQEMIGALMRGQRLTLTFRFRDGSSDLDPQSRSNLRRLSEAINRGDFDGQELVFVGFSDGVGPAGGNLRLSQERARSVRRAVGSMLDGAPVELSSDGFGEAMPMACDDTVWGRQVNRRVEVWVR
ncbi:MAG: OmpA family protein [Silicimonas sp.]|nr:OmpA family protein [Silicimonas sp.]